MDLLEHLQLWSLVRGPAERVVLLESRILSMGASAAQAKKELEQRVVAATAESHRLSVELERAVRVAETLEAR